MNENAVLVQEHRPIEVGRPLNIEGLLQSATGMGKDGVEVLERLMTIRREMNAEQSKSAYDRAMADFQAECPVVGKPKGVKDNNGTQAYSYAPLEHVILTVKPTMQKHGFSFTLDTDTDSKDGWVIAKCKVTHSAGHSETSTAKFPLGGGTRMMSTTQIYAAALTFASRRVFQNAFGIVCAGEDTIEEGLKQKAQGPSSKAPADITLKALATELWDLLKDKRGAEKNWNAANQFLWNEGIIHDNEKAPDFTAARFREVITKTKGKL